MSFINICRDNTDPFYRYKMPPIQSKIEGKGNGIKTAIVNLSDVSRALNRPNAYIVKFFGFELGAQTSITESTDRYLVNGSHDSAKLQDLLDGFINKFVLCKSCKNPETEIFINKGALLRDCKACGKQTDIDPRLKLSSYILKNPPEKSKSKKSATASAHVGNSSLPDHIGSSRGSPTPGDDFSDGEQPSSTLDKEAAAAAKTTAVSTLDDNWAVDMSEEAVAQRAKELEKLSLVSSSIDKFDELGEWLLEAEQSPSDVEIYQKISSLNILDSDKTLTVLAQALFTEDIVDEIESHTGLLIKVISQNDDKEKAEKAFLGGIERFLGVSHPKLIPSLTKILYKLYDEDIVSEDSIRKFGTTISKKYVDKSISKKVRRAAKPFLKWLDEAESESDSE
ncbi:translation initiation factor eIF5 ASCRUDRAFT_43254 [Ascoidea rubescens DSM 1968]|uniref:W2 domain-containing protein n=1 Tax=Ascoidea rubescens DSM 1968 TaxID=1344418 RepID=A0A1D2VMY9_9ASCO|nr:hypothetical protein ASCRUDRAFT_43254 [Ascoidea rubescens DSM 1968]ODV62973.1 hypothetical protein ASCRUDRAFT_43254 [Ascoidea rubescens DSM 1968]